MACSAERGPNPWTVSTSFYIGAQLFLLDELRKGPVAEKELVPKLENFYKDNVIRASMESVYGRPSCTYSGPRRHTVSDGLISIEMEYGSPEKFAKKFIQGALNSKVAKKLGEGYTLGKRGHDLVKKSKKLFDYYKSTRDKRK